MPRPGGYSFEAVMQLTDEDAQDPDVANIRIEGWQELAPHQRESCILKLRYEPPTNLVAHLHSCRDMANGTSRLAGLRDHAAYTKALSEQIQRTSPLPPTPPPPDRSEEVREKVRRETGFSKSLTDDHGRPCYPIELAPDVYTENGPYWDIISYWDREHSLHSSPVGEQLARWKVFRRFQKSVRGFLISYDTFCEFQQRVLERRQKFGLDSGVPLLEDLDEQGDLGHWVEYQDFELRKQESLENGLEKAETEVIASRKALAEAGVSAFEGIKEMTYGSHYSMIDELYSETDKAFEKLLDAEQTMELAESRLEAVVANEVGELIEKSAWIQWFQSLVEAAQIGLDDVPEYRDEDWKKGGRFYSPGVAGFKETREKMDEATGNKDDEAGARGALRLAKVGLRTAQSDDFEKTIEAATLTKTIREEIESAQQLVEERETAVAEVNRKGRVLRALRKVPKVKREMERHQILLDWIEQQRCEMLSDHTSCNGDADMALSRQADSRDPGTRSTTGRVRTSPSARATSHRCRQSTQTSILKPVNTSEVQKASTRRRHARQQMDTTCITSRQVDVAETNPSTSWSHDNMVTSLRDSEPATVHSVRSSRIPKSKRVSVAGQDQSRVKLQKRQKASQPSKNSFGGQIAMQPANTPRRRSTRTSKPPQRFRPG